MLRRSWQYYRHQAASLLKVGAVLPLLLADTRAAATAAPGVVRTVPVYETPTQLVLDPRNGQVFVVSVGYVSEVGPVGWHNGLTLLDGHSGRVLHRWPGWPSVGSNPMAGRIMVRVGDSTELLPGDPSPLVDRTDASASSPPWPLDPPTNRILAVLHYFQPTLFDGFAVEDLASSSIVHQQTLPGRPLGAAADDPQTGHFVLNGCQTPQPDSASPTSCRLWVVDVHTGRVTDTTIVAPLAFIDSMTIDAENGRLLLYDGVSALGPQPGPQYQVQLQLLSLYPLRLLRTIPLPHQYGAAAYGVVGQGIGVDEASGHALVLSSHSFDTGGAADTQPGTARLIDTNSGRVLTTLAVGAQPATVVVDGALHRAYVADALSCDVSVVDMRAGRLVARVRTGRKFPVAELVDADTGMVFVIDQYAAAVTVFNAATTRMDPPGC